MLAMNEFEKENNKQKPLLHLFHVDKPKEVPKETIPIQIIVPKGKDNKISWAFRVLLNNLLFCGLLTGGAIAMHQHNKNSYHTPPTKGQLVLSTAKGQGNMQDHVNTIQNVSDKGLNAIANNEFSNFVKHTPSKNYNIRHATLKVTPLELAVIYNNPKIVEHIIKTNPSIISLINSGNPEIAVNTSRHQNYLQRFSTLMLPTVITDPSDNFSFDAKKILIKNGLDVSKNDYQIVKTTMGNSQWREFWKEHFNSKGQNTIFASIVETTLKDKINIMNDIETIKRIGAL